MIYRVGQTATTVDEGGMSEPPSSKAYLFDRGQGDQERLIRSSEALSAFTTESCLRAGLGPGGRAIDVGCGPLGALIALAELVGSEGRVAGLDSSGDALARARLILTQRGYSTVTLVQGELDTGLTALLCPPGPFDLAYVRRFLVHQTRSRRQSLPHCAPAPTGRSHRRPRDSAGQRLSCSDPACAGPPARGRARTCWSEGPRGYP